MNKTIGMSLAMVLVAVYISIGCAKRDSGKGQESEESTKDVRSEPIHHHDSPSRYGSRGDVQDEDMATKEIAIDSVPPGASVFLVPADSFKEKVDLTDPLGTTPLVLKSSQCPDMTFLILMNIDKYLECVCSIPEMKSWIEELSITQELMGESDLDTHDFKFGVTEVVKLTTPDRSRLIAIGPMYKLKWPEEKRLCVLFIPSTVSCTAFYPLMPEPGTFTLPGNDWLGVLKRKYRFSEQQLNEAAECLTRCGSYFTRVKDPSNAERAIDSNITLQDMRSGYLISRQLPVNKDFLF